MQYETGLELELAQKQKLILTQQMLQSIEVLQLNTQELKDYIENAILENPVLEKKDNMEEVAETDIRMELIKEKRRDDEYRNGYNVISPEEEHNYEDYVAAEETLQEYLSTQLNCCGLNKEQNEIGDYMIDSLDDSGYLTESIESIGKALKTDTKKVEEVLNIIQTFEPLGVGARNLKECLLIQLRNQNLLTEKMEILVNENLLDIAQNKMPQIARDLKIPVERVRSMVTTIKSLNPRPGASFTSGRKSKYIVYVVPDIYVIKEGGEYMVSNNEKSIPMLQMSSYYSRLLDSLKSDYNKELDEYLTERFHSASGLIRSIEERKRTIEIVAGEVVKMQKDFFEKGEKYLQPMTLKDVADAVDLHESTISRTINGKYLQCDRGVYELKYFFASKVSADCGKGMSSKAVKSMIAEMVEKEDKKHPLSDQDIVEKLSLKDIEISRRTVAKYRQCLGILSSQRRKVW